MEVFVVSVERVEYREQCRIYACELIVVFLPKSIGNRQVNFIGVMKQRKKRYVAGHA